MPKSAQQIMRVLITARCKQDLTRLLQTEHLDIGCAGPTSVKGEELRIEAYVAAKDVERLQRDGVTIEVVGDASAAAAARQKEVGRGNRFASGRGYPQGMGRKLREERP